MKLPRAQKKTGMPAFESSVATNGPQEVNAMILLLEIIYCVLAFRRGWGLRALIPLATSAGLGLLIGAVAPDALEPFGPGFILATLFDLGVLGVLVTMSKTAPETHLVTPNTPLVESGASVPPTAQLIKTN
jgi:hypothetical protein